MGPTRRPPLRPTPCPPGESAERDAAPPRARRRCGSRSRAENAPASRSCRSCHSVASGARAHAGELLGLAAIELALGVEPQDVHEVLRVRDDAERLVRAAVLELAHDELG